MPSVQKITTFLWFDANAEEAVDFYLTVFTGRKVDTLLTGPAGPGTPGSVLTIDFELEGVRLVALNGGPSFRFTEAISLMIECETQAEVDRLWAKLLDGGTPSQCGWLKDRFGLSWQVTPRRLLELLRDPDPARAERAMRAMMTMAKIDIASLEKAADGD